MPLGQTLHATYPSNLILLSQTLHCMGCVRKGSGSGPGRTHSQQILRMDTLPGSGLRGQDCRSRTGADLVERLVLADVEFLERGVGRLRPAHH